MHQDLAEILLPAPAIAQRVEQMAEQIINRYADESVREIVLVSIMSGALLFTADLIRHLPIPLKLQLITASSYTGPTTSATQPVQITCNSPLPVQNAHVLLVDDIWDTGRTLHAVQHAIHSAGAASLRTAVLLHKPDRAIVRVPVDFVGFVIPDRFVVGYGLDYNGYYRNLPHIGVLRQELYA